ncbi:hypothetical protein ACJJTC_004343 [Scirpophaga incertulas]
MYGLYLFVHTTYGNGSTLNVIEYVNGSPESPPYLWICTYIRIYTSMSFPKDLGGVGNARNSTIVPQSENFFEMRGLAFGSAGIAAGVATANKESDSGRPALRGSPTEFAGRKVSPIGLLAPGYCQFRDQGCPGPRLLLLRPL